MKKFIVISVCLFGCLFVTTQTFALSFSMKDAPLIELVEWVSDATRKNIVIAPGVDLSVTFNIQNIETQEIWPFFESVLVSYDLELVDRGLFYQVRKLNLTSKSETQTSNHNSDAIVYGSEEFEKEPALEKTGILYKLFNVSFSSVDKALHSVSLGSQITSVPGTQFFYMSATDQEHEKIKTLLPALDVASPRVLVEAVVMEVASNKYYEVGVSIQAVLDNARLVATSTFAAPTLPGALASYSRGDFRSVVSALNGLDDVKLLSSPSILVSSGESGRVVVGQSVPFVTGSYTEASDSAINPFQTIERQDVGLSLSVVPVVISPDLVDMVVSQEVSTVSSSAVASDLITDKRAINTTLTIKPGEWISLGGLSSETTDISSVGVPGLMHIPFLGALFRIDKTNKVKRDLSILLRVSLV